MFFLRGKEGCARLGRFSFPARICGRADPKRCVENIKDINRKDRSKARMRVSAKRTVVWITTKVIIIVIKSGRVVRYRWIKKKKKNWGSDWEKNMGNKKLAGSNATVIFLCEIIFIAWLIKEIFSLMKQLNQRIFRKIADRASKFYFHRKPRVPYYYN